MIGGNPVVVQKSGGNETYGVYYSSSGVYSITINGTGFDGSADVQFAKTVLPGELVLVEAVSKGYSVTAKESETPIPTTEGIATFAQALSVQFYFVMPREDVIIEY